MKDIKPCSKRKKLKFKHRQKIYEFRSRKFYKKKNQKRAFDKSIFKKLLKETKYITNQSKQTDVVNNNSAYSVTQMLRVVGFKDIYPEIKNIPTLKSLLGSIPRAQIIKLSQVLTNLYKNAGIAEMQQFFSISNKALKEDFNKRFEKFSDLNIKYIFCTTQTATEILKQGYALTYDPAIPANEKYEENILKAILIINENLTDFKCKTKNKDVNIELAELLLVNSFSQKDINNFDYYVTFREMFTKSIDLFEFITNDKYFKPIYEKFKEKLQITNYKSYLKTISGLFVIMHQYAMNTKKETKIEQWAGKYEYDPNKDEDKLISTTVLDYISLQWDTVISLEENSDYKIFRNKPLIKFPDGSYEIHNVGFVLERLFSSLYFDFSTIAKELKLTNFENEYKENFGEKTLLCKYVEMSNGFKRYTALSSKECKVISQEGGEPDYYLKSKKDVVILFENKDIMINGEVKQSRDFDRIIDEYKNKLLLKIHSNGKPVKPPKPEGIGQLVKQIKKIQSGNAFWDKAVIKESTIYPVLVIADSKLLPDGLAYLMQNWYKENCETESINQEKVKPLIVMSISTLLLYSKEFQQNGFEHYFEKYYKSIENAQKNQSKNPFVNIINASIPFSEYMDKTLSKDFLEIYNSYKEKIFTPDVKGNIKE